MTLVALRLPDEAVQRAKARARADDRPLSAYLRRLLLQALEGDGE